LVVVVVVAAAAAADAEIVAVIIVAAGSRVPNLPEPVGTSLFLERPRIARLQRRERTRIGPHVVFIEHLLRHPEQYKLVLERGFGVGHVYQEPCLQVEGGRWEVGGGCEV
jgi:hypothetical protein